MKTRINIAELRDLHRTSTPGEWWVEKVVTDKGNFDGRVRTKLQAFDQLGPVATFSNIMDAHFAAAIHNALRLDDPFQTDLLSELESLRQEVELARPTVENLQRGLKKALATTRKLRRDRSLDASKGGLARAKSLTAKQRSAIAKRAIKSRWAKHKEAKAS